MLTTDRLAIRNLTTDDLDILYEYRNNKECSKYQRWEDTSKLYIVDPFNEPSIKLLEKLEFARDGYIEKLKSLLYVKV